MAPLAATAASVALFVTG